MTQDGIVGGAARFSVGGVLAGSLSLLLRNFVPFMLITILLSIPSFLIGYWEYSRPGDPEALYNPISLLSGLVSLLTTALTQSALTYGTLQDLRGQRAGIGDCIARGLASAPRVAIAAILWSVIVGIGTLLLIVPGIFLAVMLWVYVPAIVVEGAGVTASLGRSRDLTRGHRWGIFGMFVLLILAFMLVEFAVVGAVGFENLATAMLSGWAFWVLSAISVLITAYAAVMTSVGYYQLRAEKEGVVIDDIAKVFD
jgi:hypothetical protein